MALKKAKNNTITFVFGPDAKARKVYLAGSFNEWDPASRRMVKTRDGSFRAKLQLQPGEYEYKFVVDGA